MRAAARSNHASVITVWKAYEDLQQDGLIEIIAGGTMLGRRSKKRRQETGSTNFLPSASAKNQKRLAV